MDFDNLMDDSSVTFGSFDETPAKAAPNQQRHQQQSQPKKQYNNNGDKKFISLESFRLYKPRMKGFDISKPETHGYAFEFKIASYDDKVSCYITAATQNKEFSKQKGSNVFDWENKVSMKLGESDICTLLCVLTKERGHCSLFHTWNDDTSTLSATAATFKATAEEKEKMKAFILGKNPSSKSSGYEPDWTKIDAGSVNIFINSKKSGVEKKARLSLSAPEVLQTKVFMEDALRAIMKNNAHMQNINIASGSNKPRYTAPSNGSTVNIDFGSSSSDDMPF